MRKNIFVVLAVITLLTGMSMAVQRHWISTGSTDWFDPANWNAAGVPGAGDTPRLGVNDSKGIPTVWPVYNGDNSASPTDGAFLIGKVRNAQFTMQSGLMVHQSWVNIGNGTAGIKGEWFHNGGTFDNLTAGTQFTVGDSSEGYLEVTGGSLQAGFLRVSGNAGGSGNVYLTGTGEIIAGLASIGIVGDGSMTMDAGLFDVDTTLTMGDATNSTIGSLFLNGGEIKADNLVFSTAGSSIDVAGGTIKLYDDLTTDVDTWISDGNLYTSIPGNIVDYYLEEDGDIVIYSVPEPATLALLGIGGVLLRKRS